MHGVATSDEGRWSPMEVMDAVVPALMQILWELDCHHP
ncbi:MAG: hypothetical protein AVDCRST_MAG91-2696 [uncultured Sphingomonadaceae bacterium]|uniref:Uncharacterized protein n=1 Tax=uncultured Sphingomonadaceae bacterium TaxID=169976 RepID=A0A6J4TND6_9SPHN|nr:MAG: hypothetical protein AVDCRST_MAG91-2696 [uncultured Sphingomonadaceae bacterium]